MGIHAHAHVESKPQTWLTFQDVFLARVHHAIKAMASTMVATCGIDKTRPM